MPDQLLVTMSKTDLSELIDNSVSKATSSLKCLIEQVIASTNENSILNHQAKGSFSLVNVSELLKKEGFKRFGYAFIKNRITDGSFLYDEFGKITAASVTNYIQFIKNSKKDPINKDI